MVGCLLSSVVCHCDSLSCCKITVSYSLGSCHKYWWTRMLANIALLKAVLCKCYLCFCRMPPSMHMLFHSSLPFNFSLFHSSLPFKFSSTLASSTPLCCPSIFFVASSCTLHCAFKDGFDEKATSFHVSEPIQLMYFIHDCC